MTLRATNLITLAALAALATLVGCSKAPSQAIFVDASTDTGLIFQHEPGDRGDNYFPEIAGGGVALLDFDADGDLDVFFAQSGFLDEKKSSPLVNALYENRLESGQLKFVNIIDGSGLESTGYSMGAAAGDYDNDGYSDLYVTAFGANYLFHNNADRTFKDVTEETRTNDPRWSSSAAFVDYDNDGALDLFVSNYVSFSISHNKACQTQTGFPEYCAPDSYEPIPDRLFRNLGNSSFGDVSRETGLDRAYGPGLGVSVSDFNNDQALDLYVANDGQPNQLWLNDDGYFSDQGLIKGAAYNAEGMTEASMGVTAGDFDGDGDDDLFMTHLRNETNTLYENNGKASFSDITTRSGLAGASRRLTGFGTSFLDYDNDGLLDIFIANGAVLSVPGQAGEFPYREPNQLFHNIGGSFVDVSAEAGPAVTVELVSRGAAFGDIDNDGDTDIIVVNANGPAQLLLNQIGNKANWIGIDLRPGGTPGYHARVGVVVANRIIWRTSRRDGSYLSSHDPRVLVGLGGHTAPVDFIVAWRNKPAEVYLQREPGIYHAMQPGDGKSLANFCADVAHAFCD